MMTGDQQNITSVELLISDFNKNGYCIVPGNSGRYTGIEKYINELDYKRSDENFIYSLLTFSPETNIEISKQITSFFKEVLPHFNGKKFVTGSFLIKPAQVLQELQLHQDWTYAFLEQEAPVTCWAPLIDAGAETGGIFLIKGSHKPAQGYRSNSYATSRFHLSDVERNAITFLEIKRGEILLFDPSVWHGSAMNNGNLPRVALTCLMVPVNHNLLYFHKLDDDTAEAYELPEFGLETHLRQLVKNEVPQGMKLLRTIPYRHSMPESKELTKEMIF
jgi:Phytanoyl-CoA dioxygenase (PhyH)